MNTPRAAAVLAASVLAACAAPPAPAQGPAPTPGRVVLDDPLSGSTTGARRGGTFAEGGWKVTAFDDSIVWHIPTVRKGAAEFSVMGLHPRESRPGMGGKNELFHMYDWASGNADRVYASPDGVGGYRNNPFKHFIRKTNVLDTRPGKTDSLELLLKIRDNYEEPDSRALAWDAAKTYRFREEWGPDGTGNCELKIFRDGALLCTLRQPGEWRPEGHSVRIGASNRRVKDDEAPIDAVFSAVKVWDLNASAEAPAPAHSVPHRKAELRPHRPEAPAAAQPEVGTSDSRSASEVSYNGIALPKSWPPREPLAYDPVAPPYLKSPPSVIPIDVGRQLLVDDFLVEVTTLRRTFHLARYHDLNPILKPDQPCESRTIRDVLLPGQVWDVDMGHDPCSMVFSDGVWYDPADKRFKMWYMAGLISGTGYATSRDGIHWEKPKLDVVADTNLVQQGWRDSSTLWLDAEADPSRRFKMGFMDYTGRKTGAGLALSTSADGIHWGKPARTGQTGDRSTFFYNPFRKRWVFSLRGDVGGFGRIRNYWESADFPGGADWKAGEPVPWACADHRDPARDDLKTQPQLYNLDCVAYESVLLGLFSIWRGQTGNRPKPNEICVGFSRDGFHWDRPDRRAFIPVSERQGDWNWGNVQSAGGCCLIVGDALYFYASGRAGVKDAATSGVATTGLATLRRDGFASLDAGDEEGSLTTRPVTFKGRRLFVNAAAAGGSLAAEALDADGKVVEPYSRANCEAFTGDATLAEVRWRGAADLAPLAGKPVRFRFHLRRGSLYAFWVSPDASGASYGYVAAGGPGYTGPVDTVGSAALAQPK